MKDCDFSNAFTKMLDKCLASSDHHLVIGDFNYDLNCETKGKTLLELMELFYLENLVKGSTCFMKNCMPSALDVILTNSKHMCFKTLNFSTGISDCHNFISTVIDSQTPRNEKQRIQYRSYKNLDVNALNNDLSEALSHQRSTLEFKSGTCIDDIYAEFESTVTEVFNKHVPIKQTYIKPNPVPYMNGILRKAIYQKKMLYHRYLKCRDSRNWENYRKSRNYVNKLKRQSLNNYFQERCVGGSRTSDF